MLLLRENPKLISLLISVLHISMAWHYVVTVLQKPHANTSHWWTEQVHFLLHGSHTHTHPSTVVPRGAGDHLIGWFPHCPWREQFKGPAELLNTSPQPWATPHRRSSASDALPVQVPDKIPQMAFTAKEKLKTHWTSPSLSGSWVVISNKTIS